MHLLNVGHLYESTARFAHAINGRYPNGADDLRNAYVAAINTLRPEALPAKPEGFAISYEDGGWAAHCRDNGVFANIVGPSTPSAGPTREAWDSSIREAVELIRGIHPDLARLVDLVVTDVVVFNSGVDGGGSANRMPGVVLMSPAANWQVLDYAMCLVHEGLHTALFILDAVNRMFRLPPETLEEEQYRALSAVKIGQKRPLHAAFHAAAAAVPLMFMEYSQGKNDLVLKYTASLRDACEDMQTLREVCTPYSQMLLDEMSAWAKTDPIDLDQVAHALSSSGFAGYRPAAA
ncbi:HEXXH motif-containing putative peptide modification protein [Streptomyces sp. NPDC037389]|uniref:aKG-HExxH-type peptide beta-hydroxylase n=1 Tax=Streptomyces sp. NPDC037389 TaxID=3155369 RepID=UPI0033FC77FF